MKIEVMHRAKCWNVHQVPKWPIRDRLNRLHDFGCKTMQIRSSGSPMRWRPQQSSLQPALHRTTSLVEAPYELYNHSCHMHQTKFHIIQIKGKKIRPRAARLHGLSSIKIKVVLNGLLQALTDLRVVLLLAFQIVPICTRRHIIWYYWLLEWPEVLCVQA